MRKESADKEWAQKVASWMFLEDVLRHWEQKQQGTSWNKQCLGHLFGCQSGRDRIKLSYLKLNKNYWLYLVLLVYYKHTHTINIKHSLMLHSGKKENTWWFFAFSWIVGVTLSRLSKIDDVVRHLHRDCGFILHVCLTSCYETCLNLYMSFPSKNFMVLNKN